MMSIMFSELAASAQNKTTPVKKQNNVASQTESCRNVCVIIVCIIVCIIDLSSTSRVHEKSVCVTC